MASPQHPHPTPIRPILRDAPCQAARHRKAEANEGPGHVAEPGDGELGDQALGLRGQVGDWDWDGQS